MKSFITEKYGATYPIFAKIEVNGPNAHEVYQYLRMNSVLYDQNAGHASEIPWNFAKFLVNSEGKVVHYWPPQQGLKQVQMDLEKLIA